MLKPNKIKKIQLTLSEQSTINHLSKLLDKPEMQIIGQDLTGAYYKIDQILRELKYYSEGPMILDIKDNNRSIKGCLKKDNKEFITFIAYKLYKT